MNIAMERWKWPPSKDTTTKKSLTKIRLKFVVGLFVNILLLVLINFNSCDKNGLSLKI